MFVQQRCLTCCFDFSCCHSRCMPYFRGLLSRCFLIVSHSLTSKPVMHCNLVSCQILLLSLLACTVPKCSLLSCYTPLHCSSLKDGGHRKACVDLHPEGADSSHAFLPTRPQVLSMIHAFNAGCAGIIHENELQDGGVGYWALFNGQGFPQQQSWTVLVSRRKHLSPFNSYIWLVTQNKPFKSSLSKPKHLLFFFIPQLPLS